MAAEACTRACSFFVFMLSRFACSIHGRCHQADLESQENCTVVCGRVENTACVSVQTRSADVKLEGANLSCMPVQCISVHGALITVSLLTSLLFDSSILAWILACMAEVKGLCGRSECIKVREPDPSLCCRSRNGRIRSCAYTGGYEHHTCRLESDTNVDTCQYKQKNFRILSQIRQICGRK